MLCSKETSGYAKKQSFLCANVVLKRNKITHEWKYMDTEHPNTLDPAVITSSVGVLGYTTAAVERWIACKVKLFSALFHTVPSSILILWIIIIKSFYSFAVSNPGMRLPKYRQKLKPYVNLNGRHLVVIKMVETSTLDCAYIEHQRGNRTVSNYVYSINSCTISSILFNEQARTQSGWGHVMLCLKAGWWRTAFDNQSSSSSIF